MTVNNEVGLPDAWDNDCRNKEVRVEVTVTPSTLQGNPDPETDDGQVWVEIPTTSVELWENKDKTDADITRTAKIEFPSEWAGESVSEKLRVFNPRDEGSNTMRCKIYFRKHATEGWTLKHHGFVGGIGGGNPYGTGKFWVYDFAELLDQVPYSAEFSNPTAQNVLKDVTEVLDEQTIATIDRQIVINDPNNNFRFDAEVAEYEGADQLVEAGIGLNNLLADVVNIGGQEINFLELTTPDGETVIDQIARKYGKKFFYRNRDSVGDAVKWVTDIMNAIWYFEPTETGVQLVVDAAGEQGSLSRRSFIQDRVSLSEVPDRVRNIGYSEITVLRNTALYEINPINTVIVRGEGDKSSTLDFLPFTDSETQSGEYPVATVRALSLYESAWINQNGDITAELSYEEKIDSNELGETIRAAEKTMRELLNEEGEGLIRIYGEPHIDPFDVVYANYVCGDEFVDAQPIEYEVEEIKHYAKGGESYKCECYCSLYVPEEEIVVDRQYTGMEDVDTGDFSAVEDEELEEIL